MSYTGENLIISCAEGGLVLFENNDILSPSAMIEGTKNILVESGGRKRRGGTRVVHNRSAGSIKGIFQFRLAGSSYIISYDSSGVVKKSESDSLGTLTAGKYPVFEVFEDNLYVANGSDSLQLWDGLAEALSPLADTKHPTDWNETDQPSWVIKHGRGAAENLFAGGVSGKERFIYVADGDDFSDACVTQIVVNTGDGFGVVGAANFNGILWVLGKRKTFYISTDNTDKASWFATEAPWFGGVAHQGLIVRTPNDLVCMDDGGEIYSIVAVQESNDYKQASLLRPSGLDTWVRQNVNLAQIDKFHAEYSAKTQSIIFFVIKGSGSTINAALVYNTAKSPDQAWMLYDNLSFACGYQASSAVEVKRSDGVYILYGGGEDGNLWELETTGLNDDGNSYYTGFVTPNIVIPELLRFSKSFASFWLVGLALGGLDLNIKMWVDDVEQDPGTISLSGRLKPLGVFLLGTDELGWPKLGQESMDLGFKGKRIRFEVYVDVANQPFFLSSLILDFDVLDERPE